MSKWTLLILALVAFTAGAVSCVGNVSSKAKGDTPDAYVLGQGGMPALPRDVSGEPSTGAPNELAIAGASADLVQNAVLEGSKLILSSSADEVAYGLYKVNGLSGRKVTKLEIKVAVVGEGSQYSVGVSNYSDGAWDFVGTSSDETYEYDFSTDMSATISESGSFYFLVVVSGGAGATVDGATLFSRPREPGEVDRPHAARGFFVSEGLPGSIVVEWNAVESAESYELYRRTWKDKVEDGEDSHDDDAAEGDDAGTDGGETADDVAGVDRSNDNTADDVSSENGTSTDGTSTDGEGTDSTASDGKDTSSWEDSGDWTLLATVPAADTRYEDLDVVEGTVYEYRMRAINASGEGAWTRGEDGYVGATPIGAQWQDDQDDEADEGHETGDMQDGSDDQAGADSDENGDSDQVSGDTTDNDAAADEDDATDDDAAANDDTDDDGVLDATDTDDDGDGIADDEDAVDGKDGVPETEDPATDTA